MNTRHNLSAFIGLCLLQLSQASAAGNINIGFETTPYYLTNGGTHIPYVESGFTFMNTAPGSAAVGIFAPFSPFDNNNGSNSLVFVKYEPAPGLPGGYVIAMSAASPFTLNSFDGARYTSYGQIGSIDVIGHKTNGSTVTASFAAGTAWAHNALSGFSDLSSVEFIGHTAGALTIDNISVTTVTAVPEPETYAMLLAGLMLIGATARHRKGGQA